MTQQPPIAIDETARSVAATAAAAGGRGGFVGGAQATTAAIDATARRAGAAKHSCVAG